MHGETLKYNRLFDASIVSTFYVAINWISHSWGVKAHKNENVFLLFISQFENKNFTLSESIRPLIPRLLRCSINLPLYHNQYVCISGSKRFSTLSDT